MGRAINLVTEIPGPRSAEVLARKSRVVCDPIDIHVPAAIHHGSGARITDIDGNTFIDFSAGLGCQLVGYSHPKVVEAVQQQAARVSHTDFSVIPYESYVELPERLVRSSVPCCSRRRARWPSARRRWGWSVVRMKTPPKPG